MIQIIDGLLIRLVILMVLCMTHELRDYYRCNANGTMIKSNALGSKLLISKCNVISNTLYG